MATWMSTFKMESRITVGQHPSSQHLCGGALFLLFFVVEYIKDFPSSNFERFCPWGGRNNDKIHVTDESKVESTKKFNQFDLT